jgi:hypothetical protein
MFDEDDVEYDADAPSPLGWDNRYKRVYGEAGFRFLTPPW